MKLFDLLAANTPPPPTITEVIEQAQEHAVENGVIKHLSVTQLKDLAFCERLWTWNKVFHLPKKESKGQAVGKKGHKEIEDYLKTGEDCLGVIAASVLKIPDFPTPEAVKRGAVLVEERFGVDDPNPLTAGGIPLVGSIDIVDFRDLEGDPDNGSLGVFDHKFSKNITKYPTDPKEFTTTAEQHGIQMLGYTRRMWLTGKYNHVKTVRLGHNQVQREGARIAKQVYIDVPFHGYDEEWARMDTLAERAKVLAKAKSIEEAKPDWTKCDQYGGCAFKQNCFVHEARMGRSVVTSPQKSVFELVAASVGSATATQPQEKKSMLAFQTVTPVVPTGPMSGATPTPAGDPNYQAFLKWQATQIATQPLPPQAVTGAPTVEVKKALIVDIPGCNLCGEDLTAENSAKKQDGTVKHIGCKVVPVVPVVPPDAPKSDPAKASFDPTDPKPVLGPGRGEFSTTETVAQAITQVPQIAAQLVAESQQKDTALLQVAADMNVPAEAPKKRGRPRKVDTGIEGVIIKDTLQQLAEQTDKAFVQGTVPQAVRVFANCLPNMTVAPLAPYVANLAAGLAKAGGVVDIQFAPGKTVDGKDHQLGFGKWRGALAAAVREELPPPGDYFLVVKDEIGEVVAGALQGVLPAGSFVRGMGV